MIKEGEPIEDDLEELLTSYYEIIDQTELRMMLSEKYDKNPGILTIQPGAGGTESQDWGCMLYRMYMRYCEKRGYK